MSLLKLAGPNHQTFVKEALLATFGRLGLAAAKKPIQTAGHVLNAQSAVEGTARMNAQAGIGKDLGAFATKTKAQQTM